MTSMRRRRVLRVLSGLTSGPMMALQTSATSTAERPPEIAAELPQARRQSRATLLADGQPVYEVVLWAVGPPVDPGQWSSRPLALELRYARAQSGAALAGRAIEAMRRQAPMTYGQMERWQQAMAQLFPDLRAGDRLTGLQLPGEAARFYFNGRLRGEIRDPLYTQLFFGLWLSGQTPEPALRAQLFDQPAR